MNKIRVLTIIACALITHNAMGMLRFLRTQKHPYARMCHTKNTFFTLPEKNIFNASEMEIPTNVFGLLEDLYDRNNSLAEHLLKEIECAQKIMKILQHQNIIAINHTYHEEPLNLIKLKSIEHSLKKNLDDHCHTSLNIHQFTFENKTKGYVNE